VISRRRVSQSQSIQAAAVLQTGGCGFTLHRDCVFAIIRDKRWNALFVKSPISANIRSRGSVDFIMYPSANASIQGKTNPRQSRCTASTNICACATALTMSPTPSTPLANRVSSRISITHCIQPWNGTFPRMRHKEDQRTSFFPHRIMGSL
jgi:hypothetical protein